MLFGGLIGFSWLATVPLTSGAVAQIFGAHYLSTLYGIVFFSHQAGSFLGVWLPDNENLRKLGELVEDGHWEWIENFHTSITNTLYCIL